MALGGEASARLEQSIPCLARSLESYLHLSPATQRNLIAGDLRDDCASQLAGAGGGWRGARTLLSASDARACASLSEQGFLAVLTCLANVGHKRLAARFSALSRAFWRDAQLWASIKEVRLARGCTRLLYACARGDVERARFLLRCGAPPSAAATGSGYIGGIFYAPGSAPLHVAAELGCCALLNELLARGAAVNARRLGDGTTPLMAAIPRACAEAAALLCAAPAIDLNARRADGAFALLLAAQRGSAELVRVLCAAGADARLVAGDGKTSALLAARGAGCEEAVAVLLQLEHSAGGAAAESAAEGGWAEAEQWEEGEEGVEGEEGGEGEQVEEGGEGEEGEGAALAAQPAEGAEPALAAGDAEHLEYQWAAAVAALSASEADLFATQWATAVAASAAPVGMDAPDIEQYLAYR